MDDVITKIDKALLDYEVTIGVAATEGLEIATKEIHYQWTYVQSVFFTSTIITTVGKYSTHVCNLYVVNTQLLCT